MLKQVLRTCVGPSARPFTSIYQGQIAKNWKQRWFKPCIAVTKCRILSESRVQVCIVTAIAVLLHRPHLHSKCSGFKVLLAPLSSFSYPEPMRRYTRRRYVCKWRRLKVAYIPAFFFSAPLASTSALRANIHVFVFVVFIHAVAQEMLVGDAEEWNKMTGACMLSPTCPRVSSKLVPFDCAA